MGRVGQNDRFEESRDARVGPEWDMKDETFPEFTSVQRKRRWH